MRHSDFSWCMLYEAGVFWGTGKNIQVKLYFIPVDTTTELSNFKVMSVIIWCVM